MTIKLKTRLRVRAAVAALALAIGWLSMPLSLAFQEPDVCEMECCIAAGHCCCARRHAYVKGHEPKPGDVSVSDEAALTVPCPADCASSEISSKDNLLHAAPARAPLVTLASIPLQLYRDRFLVDRQSAAQPSSPRAPPTC
ncbi:MAG TPA: hypothetical protein VFV58_06240 [Blastocatellia bacterium]|jgi:hypothetical protein|nr:hypothetical protein [Blastocatellia bacterium]